MKRVAVYCRVSTDKDDQANSFESQKRYFKEYIDRNPEWELYQIFADEGISGTSTKKRRDFNRMIDLAKSGCFDFIITKEVSRFARNTVDTLQYTRELKKIGIGVLFVNDNINTLDADAELRLTIMSSIAQEESRKTSERVKWGQRRRMEQGVVFGRNMLGYDVRGGKLYINEEGAEVVRLIYHKFVHEEKGTHTIARELREAGIKPMFKSEWSNTVILRILRNEKYCGDLVQKKTFTPDYLTHEKKYNHGEEDFIILRNHHDPIISRELFELAKQELARRAPTPEQKAKHSNRYALSGKIECGCCGSRFVARSKRRKDGTQYKAWRCYEAVSHGVRKRDTAGSLIGCSVRAQISDKDFMMMIQEVIRHLNINKENLISELSGIVKSVMEAGGESAPDIPLVEKQLCVLAEKKERLMDIYLGNEITKEDYQRMAARYDKERSFLEKQKEKVEKSKLAKNTYQQMLDDIMTFIRSVTLGIKQDDTFYRSLVEKIVVHDRQHIDIFLNFLPMKWRHIGASIPISVKIAATSL
ncbi:transposon gamma-delta resolvase [Lachnospiraceae bacterium]|nr:transposon gamma-delta resolvase [Lachnospiraceae bacterium]GFI70694.1 transposon gamma-delta resolvase [Lachnospiraceae bacterium]